MCGIGYYPRWKLPFRGIHIESGYVCLATFLTFSLSLTSHDCLCKHPVKRMRFFHQCIYLEYIQNSKHFYDTDSSVSFGVVQ